MPNKIKSKKQMNFMRAAASGSLKGTTGPSPKVAKEMLDKEGHAGRMKLAKMK